jgi:uncharacterized membrane protein YtjA (UPF0391 family)
MRPAAVPLSRRAAAHSQGVIMLHYAVVFFLIAIVAAVFGFGGIAVGAAEIAKILFVIFLVLFLGSLIVGLLNRRSP